MTVETFEYYKSRCVEEGDCWIWTGGRSNGYPNAKLNGKHVNVRKFMYTHAKGKVTGLVTSTCEDPLCINPAHLRNVTHSALCQKAADSGAFSTEARKRKIAEAKRKTAKLTIEQAREIRMSTESGPVLSARYGIDRSAVNAIKRGDMWRETTSVWAGLMR